MNLRHTISLLVCGFALTASVQAADTIAITEFFNQPIGEPASRQWIELYNFGTLPASLKGYRLGSGGDVSATFPLPLDHKIAPGDYAIVLCGGRNLVPIDEAKRVFELEWLNGKGESRVLQIEQGNIILGQGGGAITLVNPQRKIAWQVFYGGDGKEGRATFYTENKFRLLNIFGGKGEPGIVRNGNDAGITGGDFLGYEGNWIREDAQAYESNPAAILTGFGGIYGPDGANGQAKPGFGSPLRGHYTQAGKK
jgi:hypothetical protein